MQALEQPAGPALTDAGEPHRSRSRHHGTARWISHFEARESARSTHAPKIDRSLESAKRIGLAPPTPQNFGEFSEAGLHEVGCTGKCLLSRIVL